MYPLFVLVMCACDHQNIIGVLVYVCLCVLVCVLYVCACVCVFVRVSPPNVA